DAPTVSRDDQVDDAEGGHRCGQTVAGVVVELAVDVEPHRVGGTRQPARGEEQAHAVDDTDGADAGSVSQCTNRRWPRLCTAGRSGVSHRTMRSVETVAAVDAVQAGAALEAVVPRLTGLIRGIGEP